MWAIREIAFWRLPMDQSFAQIVITWSLWRGIPMSSQKCPLLEGMSLLAWLLMVYWGRHWKKTKRKIMSITLYSTLMYPFLYSLVSSELLSWLQPNKLSTTRQSRCQLKLSFLNQTLHKDSSSTTIMTIRDSRSLLRQLRTVRITFQWKEKMLLLEFMKAFPWHYLSALIRNLLSSSTLTVKITFLFCYR